MNKRNSIVIKIIALSILAFVLIAFMFACLHLSFNHRGFDKWFNFGSNDYKLVKSETYNLDEIKKINFDLISADIDIRYSDVDTIKLDIYDKDEDSVNVSMSDGVLDVNYDKFSNFCIGFCFDSRRIIMYLPQAFSGELKIDTSSGDVNVLDFRNTDMIITTISGDVRVSGAKDIKVKTTSGEIDVTNVSDLIVNTKSGDIEALDVNNIVGKTTSGSLEVYRLKGSIDFSSISGDVDLSDVNLEKDSKISTVSGDVEIERINLVDILTSTVSGDIDIYTSDRNSNIKLNIKTTSGDIEVK